MGKPVLYGISNSRAFRSVWAAEEIGLEYEHVGTSFREDSKAPEYLEVNPNGRIPALVDGSRPGSRGLAARRRTSIFAFPVFGRSLRICTNSGSARNPPRPFSIATPKTLNGRRSRPIPGRTGRSRPRPLPEPVRAERSRPHGRFSTILAIPGSSGSPNVWARWSMVMSRVSRPWAFE